MGLIVFVLAVFGIVVKGIVIQSLWAWFVVPLGVVYVTLPNAIGLSVIASLFSTKIDLETKSDGDRLREVFVSLFFVLLVWGAGAIVNLFM